MAADGQWRSFVLVREQHSANIARTELRTFALPDGLRQVPIDAIGGWLWVYNTATTIRQGSKAGTSADILKAKLSLNCTGPFKIVAGSRSPVEAAPDGRPLAAKLLYLDLPDGTPGADAPCRVSVLRAGDMGLRV